jgi:hypothetical protein
MEAIYRKDSDVNLLPEKIRQLSFDWPDLRQAGKMLLQAKLQRGCIMEKIKARMSLVNDVMIHKATGKTCKVVAQTDSDLPADVIYTVEFKDGQKADCHQRELAFFQTIEDRMSAEALFPR